MAGQLKDVTGVQFVRNEVNLGFIGACNHGAALARGEILAVPQQRHDRDAGLARCDAGGVPRTPGCGTGRRQAHLSGRHACRRRAESSGATDRRGTGAATTIPDKPGVQLPARSRLLFWRVPRHSERAVPRSRRLRRAATRPRITRTSTSRSPCARPAARSTTSHSPRSCISRARRPARTSPRASSATRS